jgi:hypothetical protein
MDTALKIVDLYLTGSLQGRSSADLPGLERVVNGGTWVITLSDGRSYLVLRGKEKLVQVLIDDQEPSKKVAERWEKMCRSLQW